MKKKVKEAYKRKQPFIKTKDTMIHRDRLLQGIFELILDSKLPGNTGRTHEHLANAYKLGDEEAIKKYIWDAKCEINDIKQLARDNEFNLSTDIKNIVSNFEDFEKLIKEWSNTEIEKRNEYDMQAKLLLKETSSSTIRLFQRIMQLQIENINEVLDSMANEPKSRFHNVVKKLSLIQKELEEWNT